MPSVYELAVQRAQTLRRMQVKRSVWRRVVDGRVLSYSVVLVTNCCESEHRKTASASSTLAWSTVQSPGPRGGDGEELFPGAAPTAEEGRGDEEAPHRLALGVPTAGVRRLSVCTSWTAAAQRLITNPHHRVGLTRSCVSQS
jgi:hypothetical protein